MLEKENVEMKLMNTDKREKKGFVNKTNINLYRLEAISICE